MKHTAAIITLLLAAGAATAAVNKTPRQADVDITDARARATVSNLVVERSQNILFVSADISLASMPEGTNREIWLMPVLQAGDSVAQLPEVAVAGRTRYMLGVRHDIETTPGLTWMRRTSRDQTVSYTAQIPYRKWMDGSELTLNMSTRGCCGDDLGDVALPLSTVAFAPEVFHPTFDWVTPTDEQVKMRELSGQAFIDFPVSRTEILPDYRGNTAELAKIRATIDSVRTDRDVTIRSLSIHGYASPEGTYAMNDRLAKGRTEALKSYVERLYSFEPGLIRTEWTAEDWAGLRAWLESSSMPAAQQIIAIIDGPLQPDPREWKIKKEFPQEYAVLKADVYPALRHSDYRIEYTVRPYTDPAEIMRVARTRPQHLSLAEFFAGAQGAEPGSAEYMDLFETAARIYPESEVANLNAANAALQQGALDTAERYLAKAGDSPEAIYARGILASLRGDYAAARPLFETAAKLKVADAPAALQQLDELEGN